MNRRTFLLQGAATLAALKGASSLAAAVKDGNAPSFQTANTRWQKTYDGALAVLAGNVQLVPGYEKPVLIEGSTYQGIWMECGPMEALVYRRFRPEIARNSHMAFFARQRPDGQLPYSNKIKGLGWGQIQMVVPIAATAWELARATGDEELLRAAYNACSAWDAWLLKFRNTRGTGLTEGFCTYDTGNDNSPRWTGAANNCPDQDARKIPARGGVPRLCPDLSATTYGARVALAAMAQALGKPAEAERWRQSAEQMRGLILSKLYVQEDAAFYDLDAQNQFVRVRSEIITRVCGEHIPDQRLFDELWTRQIHNPQAFWPAIPLPSVAVDDPHFVQPIPRNSWGGASQALTALRATRWFDHYHRAAEFSTMMDAWCEEIQRDGTYRQQIDPLHGGFTQTDAPHYSPCALVIVDYTWRLAGINEEADELQWNGRPGHPASASARFDLRTDGGAMAAMQYDADGVELRLGGKRIGRIESGAARVITSKAGMPIALLGIHEQPQKVMLHLQGQPKRHFSILPNQRIAL